MFYKNMKQNKKKDTAFSILKITKWNKKKEQDTTFSFLF